jgi:hypothetical protein
MGAVTLYMHAGTSLVLSATDNQKTPNKSKGAAVKAVKFQVAVPPGLWQAFKEEVEGDTWRQLVGAHREPSMEQNRSWSHLGKALQAVVQPCLAPVLETLFRNFEHELRRKGALPMTQNYHCSKRLKPDGSEEWYSYGFWQNERENMDDIETVMRAFLADDGGKARIAAVFESKKELLTSRLKRHQKERLYKLTFVDGMKVPMPEHWTSPRHWTKEDTERAESDIKVVESLLRDLGREQAQAECEELQRELRTLFGASDANSEAWVQFALEVYQKADPETFRKSGANWKNWTCQEFKRSPHPGETESKKCDHAGKRCNFHAHPLWVQLASLFMTFTQVNANAYEWDVRYQVMAL